jgi:hypothetical protein
MSKRSPSQLVASQGSRGTAAIVAADAVRLQIVLKPLRTAGCRQSHRYRIAAKDFLKETCRWSRMDRD